MKAMFLTTGAVVVLFACAHHKPIPTFESGHPAQALILLFRGLTPDALESSQYPALASLKREGLLFTEATVGHLPLVPALTSLVLVTAKHPRHLPIQSGLIRDATDDGLVTLEEIEDVDSIDSIGGIGVPPPFASERATGRRFALIGDPKARLAGILLSDQHWVLYPKPSESQTRTLAGLAMEKAESLVGSPDWEIITLVVDAENVTQADVCLGKIFKRLQETDRMKNSLIVVAGTAKATQTERLFTSPKRPPEPMRSWKSSKYIDAVEWDHSLRVWLNKSEPIRTSKVADDLRTLPAVSEVYTKQVTGRSAHYLRTYRNPALRGAALEWVSSHHQGLMETFAAPHGPDVVVLFMDGEKSNLEKSEKILFWVASPNLRSEVRVSDAPVILADIAPIVGKLLGFTLPEDLDGDSTAITRYIRRTN